MITFGEKGLGQAWQAEQIRKYKEHKNNSTKSSDTESVFVFSRYPKKFNFLKPYLYPTKSGCFLSEFGYYRIRIQIFSDNIQSVFTPNHLQKIVNHLSVPQSDISFTV